MLVNQGVETPVPEKVRGGGVRHMMIFIKEEIIECRRGGGGRSWKIQGRVETMEDTMSPILKKVFSFETFKQNIKCINN